MTKRCSVKKRKVLNKANRVPRGHVVTAEEIRRYRRVSTARKLEWLEEMRLLFFASMTPALFKRSEKLRKKGY